MRHTVSRRWRSLMSLSILAILVACGGEQPLTTSISPAITSHSDNGLSGLSEAESRFVASIHQKLARDIALKPPKSASYVTVLPSQPERQQIFQGETNEATIEDAALIQSLNNLIDRSSSQEDLKAAAGLLIGDRDRFDDVVLRPALGNATANYITTDNADITLEDVAAILAARELSDREFDETLLAETATRLLAPVAEIQSSQVLRLPILPPTPSPTASPRPTPTITPTQEFNNIGIPDRREGTLSSTDETLSLGESVDFFNLDLSTVNPEDSVTVTLNSETFDPYLLLVNRDSNLIILEDDDGGDGLNSQLAFVVNPEITYQIGVTSYSSNETGSYTLETTVSEDPFTTLNIPGTINGILDINDEIINSESNTFAEFYDLADVNPGQSIALNLSSEQFDPVLLLFGIRGAEVEEIGRNDDIIDGRGTLDSQLEFVAEADVLYIAVVTSFTDNATGSYRLRGTLASPSSPTPSTSPSPSPLPTEIPTPTPSPSPLQPQSLRPNDPLFEQQYGFEAIGMPLVWGAGQAVNPVAIAVIDDGVMAGNHPDLPPRSPNNARFVTRLSSSNQILGFNDARGEDAADTPYIEFREPTSEFNNPTHHGTHVAGTIAAIANNDSGVSGTVWGGNTALDVELIAIDTFQFLPQFSDKQFLTLTSDYIEAIRYAAGLPNRLGQTLDRPVDVINMSLGGLGSCPFSTESAIADAVAQGVTVVVAAGNDSTTQAASPASCPSVTLTVGATDRNNDLANFSNYNFNDISAPGVGILSTLRPDALYAFYDGTSMAAPHVSGAVAMLRAVNPSLSPADIQNLLRNSATPTGDLRLGAGVLNVAGAFDALVPGSTGASNAVQLKANVGGAVSDGELASPGDIAPDAPFLAGQVLVTFHQPDLAEQVTHQLFGDRARITRTPTSATDYALVQFDVTDLDPVAARENTLEAIATFVTSDHVAYAEPNYILQTR